MEPDIPATASAYAAAIQARPDGAFIGRFQEEGRLLFSTLYGGPFFAMARLAPEICNTPDAKLLLADAGGIYAEVGGRWLALYVRALQPALRRSITICTSKRPEFRKAPKSIQFQPGQQILVKPWRKHLASLDVLPDLIFLPVPPSFDSIMSMLADLSATAPGRKVIVRCDLQAEALLVGALFRAHGFATSDVVGFDLKEGEPQHCATGAWWLAATARADGHLVSAEMDALTRLRFAHGFLERQINENTERRSTQQIAAAIATRSGVLVEGKQVRAALVSHRCGIDLDSGRFFIAGDGDDDAPLTWEERTAPAELLAQAPIADESVPNSDDRLQLLMWMANVVAALDKPESDVPENAPGLQETAPIDVDCGGATEPETADADDTAPLAVTPPPNAAPAETQPVARPQRSRLARRAGTVDVLALAGRLGRGAEPPETIFEKTRARIQGWLKNKGFPITNPTGNSHIELPDGEVTIESDDTRVWSLRFDDRRYMEQGSIWRVEATLIQGHESVLGLRLIQVRSSEEVPLPVVSGVPQVVADIAKGIGLSDAGEALLDRATRLKGTAGAERLIHILLNPQRVQPVIVIAGGVDASADRLAKRLTGVAHVICIDATISQHLIRRLGRERSVYGHAARLYRPGFTAESDPYLHSVYALNGNQLPRWLGNDLFEEACAISLEADDLDERVPSFQTIRQLLAEQQVRSSEQRLAALREQASSVAASKDEQITKLRSMCDELNVALDKHRAQAIELETQVRDLREQLLATRRERDEANQELRQNRYKFHSQRNDSNTQDEDHAEDAPYPDSWDDLETWIEVYGNDKLVLLPAAAKAARESPFKNIPLAYKAMDYLVRFYAPMRTRDKDDNETRDANQRALAAFGLELSPVGDALDDRRYKQEYRRRYDNRDVWLDLHLKAGVGFDRSTLFRLYFCYDTATGKVVIGHMPTHLTNRITHAG